MNTQSLAGLVRKAEESVEQKRREFYGDPALGPLREGDGPRLPPRTSAAPSALPSAPWSMSHHLQSAQPDEAQDASLHGSVNAWLQGVHVQPRALQDRSRFSMSSTAAIIAPVQEPSMLLRLHRLGYLRPATARSHHSLLHKSAQFAHHSSSTTIRPQPQAGAVHNTPSYANFNSSQKRKYYETDHRLALEQLQPRPVWGQKRKPPFILGGSKEPNLRKATFNRGQNPSILDLPNKNPVSQSFAEHQTAAASQLPGPQQLSHSSSQQNIKSPAYHSTGPFRRSTSYTDWHGTSSHNNAASEPWIQALRHMPGAFSPGDYPDLEDSDIEMLDAPPYWSPPDSRLCTKHAHLSPVSQQPDMFVIVDGQDSTFCRRRIAGYFVRAWQWIPSIWATVWSFIYSDRHQQEIIAVEVDSSGRKRRAISANRPVSNYKKPATSGHFCRPRPSTMHEVQSNPAAGDQSVNQKRPIDGTPHLFSPQSSIQLPVNAGLKRQSHSSNQNESLEQNAVSSSPSQLHRAGPDMAINDENFAHQPETKAPIEGAISELPGTAANPDVQSPARQTVSVAPVKGSVVDASTMYALNDWYQPVRGCMSPLDDDPVEATDEAIEKLLQKGARRRNNMVAKPVMRDLPAHWSKETKMIYRTRHRRRLPESIRELRRNFRPTVNEAEDEIKESKVSSLVNRAQDATVDSPAHAKLRESVNPFNIRAFEEEDNDVEEQPEKVESFDPRKFRESLKAYREVRQVESLEKHDDVGEDPEDDNGFDPRKFRDSLQAYREDRQAESLEKDDHVEEEPDDDKGFDPRKFRDSLQSYREDRQAESLEKDDHVEEGPEDNKGFDPRKFRDSLQSYREVRQAESSSEDDDKEEASSSSEDDDDEDESSEEDDDDEEQDEDEGLDPRKLRDSLKAYREGYQAEEELAKSQARARAEEEELEREQAEEAEAARKAANEAAELARKTTLVPKMSDAIEAKLNEIMQNGRNRTVARTADGIELTRNDFGRLVRATDAYGRPIVTSGTGVWLNDELVNCWMSSIVHRKKELTGWKRGDTPAFVCYNSNWFNNYTTRGVGAIKNWSRRQGIQGDGRVLDVDKIFFPINTGAHWTILIVSGKDRKIEYLNSMGAASGAALPFKFAREWLSMELGQAYQASEWTEERGVRSAQQLNTDDCGVFACMNALSAAKGLPYQTAVAADNGMVEARRMMGAVLLEGGFGGEIDL